MGRACSTYGGEVRVGFLWQNMMEDYLEEPGVIERIILKWIFEKLDGGLE